MRYAPKVHRKDALQDHVHALPNGKLTGGSLYKPMVNARAGLHTHLYEMDGKTYESSPAYEGADHVHNTELGESAGPQKAPTGPGPVMSRTDSAEQFVQRRGSEWFVVSSSGQPLSRHRTQSEAKAALGK